MSEGNRTAYGGYSPNQNSEPYPNDETTLQELHGSDAASACTHEPVSFSDFTISEPYRYFLLVVGSAGCLLASFCYTFALFAQAMVAEADMDMSSLTSVATVMLVFSYFTLPYAYVFDAFGPKPVLLIGTILLPLGCLLMGLTFNGTIPATTVNFSVFLGIMGGGCIVFDIGTVVAVLSWFPTYKGPVVAVMKTFAGLGSAIVACIELAFFEEKPEHLFFFLMSCAIVMGVFSVCTMRLPPYHLTGRQQKYLSEAEQQERHRTKQLFFEQRPPRLRMFIGLGFVVFLIIYLPCQSAALAYTDNVKHSTYVALAVVMIIVLACYPVICLPIRLLGGMGPSHTLTVAELEARHAAGGTHTPNDDNIAEAATPAAATDAHEHVMIAGEEMERVDEDEMEHDLEFIAPQFQSTFLQSLLTLRLWAIFAACFAIIGAQLVILFHYPYICSALRGKPTDAKFKALMGALSGVGSALGRLVLAWLENYTQNKAPERRTPITVVLFVPAAASLLGLLLYLVLPGDGLVAAHFIMAIGNGSAAAAAVLVFRAVFAKEPAKHYNFGFLAAMVSAIVLNRVVYGEWFVSEYNKASTKKYGPYCLQKSCVLMPLLLMLGLNALSFIAVTYVHVDYTRFVRSVLASHDAKLTAAEERRERRQRAVDDVNDARSTEDSEVEAICQKRNSGDDTICDRGTVESGTAIEISSSSSATASNAK